MKTIVSDNGDYEVHADVVDINAGGKEFMLRFSSFKHDSKTGEDRTKLELFLTRDELVNLENLISTYTKNYA